MNKYIKAFVTQLYAAISGVILIKIMTMVLDKEMLGLFIVIRRIVLFTFPLLAVNLNTASAKFVSSDLENSHSYIKLGLGAFLINFGIVVVASLVFREQMAILLFNSKEYGSLLFVLLLYLFCATLYSFAVNFYRGQRKFEKMNAVTIFYWTVALVAIPLSLLLGKENDFKIIYSYFIVFSLFVVLVTVPWGVRQFRRKQKGDVHKLKRSEFFRYGIFRLPSSLFASGIFFLPVFVASKFYGLSDAAVAGLVVYLVQVSHIFGSSMGMLLLPEFSFRSSVYTKESLKGDFQKLFEFVLSTFVVLGIIMFFFVREIILVMFDKTYIVYKPLFSVSTLVVGFYLSYVVFRSVLDGLYVKPYSTVVNFVGAAVFIFSAFVLKSFSLGGIVTSFAIAIISIAFLSAFILKTKLNVRLINKKNLYVLGWAMLVLSIFTGIRFAVDCLSFWYSLGIKVFVFCVVLLLTFMLYKKMELFWMKKILKLAK